MSVQEPRLQRVHVAPQEEECATQAGMCAPTRCFGARGGAGGTAAFMIKLYFIPTRICTREGCFALAVARFQRN